MKKLSLCTFAILAATTVACASNPPGGKTGGSTGSGGSGAGGSGAGNGFVLMPSTSGFMDGTVAGVTGAWYSYGDSYNNGGPGDCQNAGFAVADCSTATSPAFGAPFTNTNGQMCLTGNAAIVMNSNYSAIWGVGIGFDFDNAGNGDAGADAGGGSKLPWNATTYGITGFSFTVTGVPVGGQMRVEFPFTGQYMTDAPYWGGTSNNLSPFTTDGTYSFKWTDVGGPSYLTSPTPPAFDPTHILSAQFHVVTNTKGAIPISNLCISNVTLTTN